MIRMADGYWLGLDFGTSSVKALLVGAAGAVRGRATIPYPSLHGAQGEAEQDTQDYLEAARQAIAACGAAEVELSGVGLAGQTPTLVLVGADGEAVRPAITWQDQRAGAEAQQLESELGSAERLFGTSLPWTGAYPPAKLLWLAENEPDSVARTRWVLQPKDFVGLRLTGSPLSDPWSSKGLCNVRTLAPAVEFLDRAGWGVEVAPPLAPAWESRGTVTPSAAAEFGLRAGTPVSVGWSDALAAMLAVGAFDEPVGFVLSGTSSIVGVSAAGAVRPQGHLLIIPATCAPLEVVYGPTQSSGASIEWLARLLRCEPEEALQLAVSAPAAQEVPVFVPYLSGERAPVWRADVRGTLLGISAGDGPAELARAVVMGVCLSERHVLGDAEEHLGTNAAEVAVAGRGSSEPPWYEARLAALGRPLRLLGEPDVSALGAAMLGAAAVAGGNVAAGRFLRGELRTALPSRSDAEGAARRFATYRRAVDASLSWADGGS
jgi:xylulokinase